MPCKQSDILRHGWESSEFSDFTLICGDTNFPLHRLVVCPQSPVIHAALHGQFEESKTGIIRAETFHLPIITCMLHYLYFGEYQLSWTEWENVSLYEDEEKPQSTTNTTDGEDPVASQNGSMTDECTVDAPEECSLLNKYLAHIHINAAGDYYDIPSLRELSRENIQTLFEEEWKPELFLSVLKFAMQKTGDTEMLDLLASTAVDNMSELLNITTFNELDWQKDFVTRVFKQCACKVESLKLELNFAEKKNKKKMRV